LLNFFFGLKHGFCLSKSYSQNKNQDFVTDFCSALNFRPTDYNYFLFRIVFSVIEFRRYCIDYKMDPSGLSVNPFGLNLWTRSLCLSVS